MTELEDIVERAYQLFGNYKVKAPLDVCTDCCMSKEEERQLVNLSVRHIPFELLYEYNTAAKPKKPDMDEFRHFLPRFLELTAELQFLHHSLPIVLYRFDSYDKDDWNEDEQQLMQDFGLAFFKKCLSTYPLPDLEDIEGVLIMLYRTKIDMNPLLELWLQQDNIESVLHFNELHQTTMNAKGYAKSLSAFADDQIAEMIYTWITNSNTKSTFAGYIEEHILNPSTAVGDSELTQLSWTYDLLTFNTSANS